MQVAADAGTSPQTPGQSSLGRSKNGSGLDSLLDISAGSFVPLLQQQRAGLRIESGQHGTGGAETKFAPTPPSSADVINEGERDVETGSRAFRREVAREQACEQFQQDRNEHHQAFKEKADTVGVEGRNNQRGTPRATEPGSSHLKSETNSNKHAAHRQPAGVGEHGAAKTTPSTPARSHVAAERSVVTTNAAQVENAASVASVRAHPFVDPVQSRAISALSATASAATRGVGNAGASVGARTNNQVAALKPAPAAARGRSFAAVNKAATRAAEQAERADNLKRIVRIVARHMRGGHSRAVMRLDPPELGNLRLEMDLRGSVMQLRIDASTHVAHRLLHESLDKLRHGLEASGIQLEKVEVRPPTPAPEAAEQASPEHADTPEDSERQFAEADAEHSREQGTESPPQSLEDPTSESESATESLVNVIA